MLSFALSGIAFFLYAFLTFKRTKIFYPSVVFSFMWGLVCLFIVLIENNFFNHLYLEDYYSFHYMDKYIPYFTFISLCAFSLAHLFFPGKTLRLSFSEASVNQLVSKYRWVIWLNFFGGILRIILMGSLVGFDDVMDYRSTANGIMMKGGNGFIGIVFQITAYIQLLANMYIALCGFKAGFEKLDLKQTIWLFILYSPSQLATGGRLFVLYFILFFFGSFLIGRGCSLKKYGRKFIQNSERKIFLIMFGSMLALVVLIAYSRSEEKDSESPLAKFTYVSEGTLETEHYMRFIKPDEMSPDLGTHLFLGKSDNWLNYRGYLQQTYMSSTVMSIISPLYSSFGYWGSLIVWFLIALFFESIAIVFFKRLTIIRFFVILAILKIMYETVLTNSIFGNFALYELILLFVIFYQPIFGKFEIQRSKSSIRNAI